MSKASNIERAKLRTECRQVLAEHIRHTVQLDIKPEDVRLIPAEGDRYEWKPTRGKEHLFEKNLSKHSAGPLLELIRGAGVSFCAQPRVTTVQPPSELPPSPSIRKLLSENADLTRELLSTKARAETAEKRVLQLMGVCKVLKRKGEARTQVITKYRNIMTQFLVESAPGQGSGPHVAYQEGGSAVSFDRRF